MYTGKPGRAAPSTRVDRRAGGGRAGPGSGSRHSRREAELATHVVLARDRLERREELGVAWLTRRNQLLEQGCASEQQVAALLHEAVDEVVLAPEEAREEADAITGEAKERAKEVEEEAKQA